MESIVTESEKARKTPDFNTRLASNEIIKGLVYVVVLAGILYATIRYIFRGNDPGSILSSWYRWIVPFLCIFSMPLLGLFFELEIVLEGISVLTDKNDWIKKAARTKATIIDKRKREDYEYREDYSYAVTYAELKLQYTPTLAKDNSSEQVLWASISHDDYEKFKLGDTVDIYYSISDPSMFLIEGEVT